MTLPTGNLNRVYNLLDHIDSSHLRPEFRQRAQELFEHNYPFTELSEMKDDLIRDARELLNRQDPYELGEVLVICAMAEHHWNQLDLCEIHLLEAINEFRGHKHRLAVTEWLLGILDGQMQKAEEAAVHLANAREIFDDLGRYYQLIGQDVKVETEVGAASLVNQAYQWLNVHEPSHLSPTVRELINRLNADISLIRGGIQVDVNTGQALHLIEHIITATRDNYNPIEHGEALIECGLAIRSLGNPYWPVALRHLQQAVRVLHPNTHHQAVAHWMLGCMLWEDHQQQDEITRHWDIALTIFEELEREADYRNRAERANWYRAQINTMQMAINKRLGDTLLSN